MTDIGGIALVPYEDAITAELSRILPNTHIEEDGILDDTNLRRVSSPTSGDGVLEPYVVPRYGTLRRKPQSRGSGSFAGTRKDEYYSTVDISCVAPTGRMARRLLDACVDALVGFKPDGVVEMSVEGLPDNFTIMNDQGRPAAFVSSLRLRFGVNAVNAGSYIEH
jgi:hypothetical protein